MSRAPQPADAFEPLLVVGLMSGTSADGVDAAILRTDGASSIETLGGITAAYEPEFRARLIQTASQDVILSEVLSIERRLTQVHADAVAAACQASGVTRAEIQLVGFHGHTIRHLPKHGMTWQLGDGSLLAMLVGSRVVFDFRRQDLAAGGQGAPLAPLYHQALVGNQPGPHLLLNLGGVANVTWIDGDQLLAGDTGPGCGLLDMWVHQTTGQACDKAGQLAAQGRIDRQFVEAVLAKDSYFAQPFPKSADRFAFTEIDVSSMSPADGAATLCAITVSAVSHAARSLPQPPRHVWVTGGGRQHPLMMQLLGDHFSHVAAIDELGHDGDFVEAACFGWLAVRRLRGLPTALPSTTGARQATCGGSLVEPPS